MKLDKLYKILLSDNPSELIIENEKEIFELIPQLKECKNFNQNNDWHVYDVYNHILHVVDYVDADLTLRLTALFHDIGKSKTYIEDENKKGHFYGHWIESQKIFDNFAKEYSIDLELNNTVSKLIYYHDIRYSTLNEEEKEKLVIDLGYSGIIDLYKLKEADLKAQNKKYHYLLDKFQSQKQALLSMIKH